MTRRRGRRWEVEHRQGYRALGSGIPHLWGKKQTRGGRHRRANLPWVGEKNSNRRAADTTAKCKDPVSGVKSVEGLVPVFRD